MKVVFPTPKPKTSNNQNMDPKAAKKMSKAIPETSIKKMCKVAGIDRVAKDVAAAVRKLALRHIIRYMSYLIGTESGTIKLGDLEAAVTNFGDQFECQAGRKLDVIKDKDVDYSRLKGEYLLISKASFVKVAKSTTKKSREYTKDFKENFHYLVERLVIADLTTMSVVLTNIGKRQTLHAADIEAVFFTPVPKVVAKKSKSKAKDSSEDSSPSRKKSKSKRGRSKSSESSDSTESSESEPSRKSKGRSKSSKGRSKSKGSSSESDS